ncbi:MAG: hypothetical protein NC911_07505 [Candidatus Omnitrophica bacterium]|nr:hypothetical protein [Candidatus Omnitrophota bacterium]
MTTIIRHTKPGWCDPQLWRRWYGCGCDLFGYAHGTPPDFRPHSFWTEQVEVVRAAFHEIQRQKAGNPQ